MENNNKIIDINIVKEMNESFLDYAMSVIVSRALPDAKDGMKPVHRRIMYAMNQIGNHSDKPYQKSARTVGEVIGKYHPHGDSSVYDTMVRMAQDFSYRYPLIDGHGNFGSLDGDGAAAMRYTEARMSKLAMHMLRDINKNTVDMKDNYDGQEKEPVVLPSKFPNLLVNGATGIAVGMATNIPPHNLKEVIDGIIKLINNKEISIEELNQTIQGPDYPTGGITLGVAGIRSAYNHGKGSVVTKAKAEVIEKDSGRDQIIITEIPYQVNKAKLLESIADLVRNKSIEGIADLRDETNHKGLRVVIELKRDAIGHVILNQLYKNTNLQKSFAFNNIVLVNGEPKRLNLKETLEIYVKHQFNVITRRTKFDLEKAESKIHILEGLSKALSNIDKIIELIKKSKNSEEAQQELISAYSLSESQAKAILEMKLSRLTGLEREKLEAEILDLKNIIANYKNILGNEPEVYNIVKSELNEIKEKFGDDRKTYIDPSASVSIDDESLIPVEDVVITLSKSGYIKRIPASTYKAQNRGGKGIKGQNTLEEDLIYKMLYTTTHRDLMFFTNRGKVYRLRAHEVPEFNRISKGIPAINLINIEKGEKIKALLNIDQYSEETFFTFATANGLIKKTKSSEYQRVRKTGKIAIALRDDDELLDVALTSGNDEIILGNSNGKSVRFNEVDVRSSGRKSFGVKGMNVDGGKVISMAIPAGYTHLLSVSSRAIGKLTPIQDYRLIKRGGKGVKTIKITPKTGKLVEVLPLNGSEELMLITTKGQIIRLKVEQISISSRNTQGVRLMDINESVRIQSAIAIETDAVELDEYGDPKENLDTTTETMDDSIEEFNVLQKTTEVKNSEILDEELKETSQKEIKKEVE